MLQISLLLSLLISSTLCAECNLADRLVQEIASYGPIVQKIIDTSVNGEFKGVTFDDLSDFVDRFGNRPSGTQRLEDSIDYILQKSNEIGLDNVHGEDVQVPHWQRGEETATLVQPFTKNLHILGLGFSVATPAQGITAPVLVVRSFDELRSNAALARGRIVVYNQEWVSYGVSNQYRSRGASEAARVGAVAALIRSVTPFSMATPHTGSQTYQSDVTKIPTACITVEDAKMLQRIQNRGVNITINVKLSDQTNPETRSRNAVMEIEGSEKPKQVVFVSGHIDSWDVGTGAMDDGGGVFISWDALKLLKLLRIRPRRTIRAVLWTAEEVGLVGAREYQRRHALESANFTFFMESDGGTFHPFGVNYAAGAVGGCILQEIVKLFASINASQLRKSTGVGSDISVWISDGFPGAELLTENEKYFWYHHTEADTLDVEDSGDLDRNTALWASLAYVIADLSVDFPRF